MDNTQEAKYVIVKDVDNKIEYQEVYDREIDRALVASRREKLEILKAKKLEIEAEIAEYEAEIALAEKIIAIADAKKEAEEKARLEAEQVVAEEPAKEDIILNV